VTLRSICESCCWGCMGEGGVSDVATRCFCVGIEGRKGEHERVGERARERERVGE
jgi:hypothetical protein